MKTFKSLPLILISIVLVVFSVANRQAVTVNFWPFPVEVPDIPLFFVFFGGIFIGLVLAGVLLAMRGVRHHMDMRHSKKEAQKMAKAIDTLEGELDKKPPKVEQKDYSEKGPNKGDRLEVRK